jgi:ATP-dependent RNA helicase RhlE
LVFPVSNRRKRALLTYFLKRKGSPFMKEQKALIFCRTKQRAERLAQTLEEDGFKALPIHKGMSVSQRRNAIQMFRDGQVQVSDNHPLSLSAYLCFSLA